MKWLGNLLRDGGPSSTRLINLTVAVTGAWLLYYWAKSGGDMGWPWATCFVAYLAYGAGPHVLQKLFDVFKMKFGGGNGNQEATEAKSEAAARPAGKQASSKAQGQAEDGTTPQGGS